MEVEIENIDLSTSFADNQNESWDIDINEKVENLLKEMRDHKKNIKELKDVIQNHEEIIKDDQNVIIDLKNVINDLKGQFSVQVNHHPSIGRVNGVFQMEDVESGKILFFLCTTLIFLQALVLKRWLFSKLGKHFDTIY